MINAACRLWRAGDGLLMWRRRPSGRRNGQGGMERRTVNRYLVGVLAGVAAVVSACSFKPRIGMSFDDWNRECRSKALSGGTLLERKGTTATYYCYKQDYLYIFENGALAQVVHQPAYDSGSGVNLVR